MTDRTTIENLETLVDRLNELTGQPEHSYRWINEKHTANIGNYHLDWAYNGCSLQQMTNEGGGVRNVLTDGHVPKRELDGLIRAYIKGIELERGAIKVKVIVDF